MFFSRTKPHRISTKLVSEVRILYRAHAVLDDRGFECFELSVEVFVLFFSLDVGDCYSLRESLIPPLDVNLGDEYLCSLSCFHDSSISHSRSA